MKKIKPQYGKVVPPAIKTPEVNEASIEESSGVETLSGTTEEKQTELVEKSVRPKKEASQATMKKGISRVKSEPNPFLQTKEIFGKARLTKVGYRVRTDYVEILDIIKKIKKNGYTLEAVLDDALTYYFENSEDGKEALKKAEIFYS